MQTTDEKHDMYGVIEISYQARPKKPRKDLYSVESSTGGYIRHWDKGFSPTAIEELKQTIKKYIRDDSRLDSTVKERPMDIKIHAWRSFDVWHTDEKGNRGLVKERPTEELLNTSFVFPNASGSRIISTPIKDSSQHSLHKSKQPTLKNTIPHSTKPHQTRRGHGITRRSDR